MRHPSSFCGNRSTRACRPFAILGVESPSADSTRSGSVLRLYPPSRTTAGRGPSCAARCASARKPSAVSAHVRERVVDVRVEPGRDEHEIRLELRHRPLDRRTMLRGSRRRRFQGEWKVDDVARLLVRPAGPWIERPLMQRDEQEGFVARDDVLRPVAVVHVPVDDRDARQPELVPAPSARRSRRCRTGRNPSPDRAPRGAPAAATTRSRRGAQPRSPRPRSGEPPRTSTRCTPCRSRSGRASS